MASDFDFTLGRDHLRGSGWRGLVALGFVLTMRREAIVVILAFSVKPLYAWVLQLPQLLRQLIGT